MAGKNGDYIGLDDVSFSATLYAGSDPENPLEDATVSYVSIGAIAKLKDSLDNEPSGTIEINGQLYKLKGDIDGLTEAWRSALFAARPQGRRPSLDA